MDNAFWKFLIKLRDKGFFSIIVGTTLVKIMTFASTIFLPQVIDSKYTFGVLTDIDNIRSYFLIINGFGITNAVMRFCVSDRNHSNEKKGIFLFILTYGVLIDCIITVIYIVICINGKFNYPGEKNFLLFMSAWLILSFLLEAFQLLMRAQFKNTQYIITSCVYVGLMFVAQISLGSAYQIWGVLWGRYFAIIITVISAAIYLFLKYNKSLRSISFPANSIKKKIIIFGLVCMFANASSLIMQSNEKKILSDTLQNAEILANYQVASTIISIISFLLNAIIVFVTPFFVAHRDDKIWCSNFYKKIMRLNFYVMVPVHVILFIFSKPFLSVLFGARYTDAFGIMRMMLFASFGHVVFRALPGNILPLLGFEKYNLVVNLVLVGIHYILATIFIGFWGIHGAALALIIAYFVSGFLYMFKLKEELKT